MILTIFQSDFAESEESISSCKKREGELLEFTQRLTETNATLQVGYLPLPFCSSFDYSDQTVSLDQPK